MESREPKVGDRIVMKDNLETYSKKKGLIIDIFWSSNPKFIIYKVLLPDLDMKYHYSFYRERFELDTKLYYYVI